MELLLLHRVNDLTWETLAGGKGLAAGRKLVVAGDAGQDAIVSGEVIEVLGGARRLVRFEKPVESWLEIAGKMPLPPYIHTPLTDPQRYQTVYAREAGSAAAPTAGLHFTPELMVRLEAMGVGFARLTLHVGLDTFAPVTEDDPQAHKIHTEWCELGPGEAAKINTARRNGGRIVAVGTTSMRTLETAAQRARPGDLVGTFNGPTDLFILPGYRFKAVDALITNFHLPKSTLLMLVSAFAGRECILAAYQDAIRSGYRFYSFGDAMFII